VRRAFAFVAMLALALQSIHVLPDRELHLAAPQVSHPAEHAAGHSHHSDATDPQLPEKEVHTCPCCILCGKIGPSLAPLSAVLNIRTLPRSAGANFLGAGRELPARRSRRVVPVGARAPPAPR
jgi:hypothetical protein